jgi:primosomal protein N' (replication factor Y)
MLVLRLDARDEGQVKEAANDMAIAVRAAAGAGVRVLGPAEAPIARVRGRSRYQIWLSSKDRPALVAAARAATAVKRALDVRLAIDVDPQSVL